MSLPTLHCFSGSFVLERRPPAPNQPLQAWDAADEYLLATVAPLLTADSRVLVINDSFGALAVALHPWKPHTWGDSVTAELALADNRDRNKITDSVMFLPSTTFPPDIAGAEPDAAARYDVVVWRVPKARALFEQQLAGLQPVVDESTVILAGGMDKHLPPYTREVLSRLGRADVLHGQKKAHLFRLTPDSSLPELAPPAEAVVTVPGYDLTLGSGPNVFAREKLDIGAQFFLQRFARLPKAKRIADLGCGNGVLGLVAKRLRPGAQLDFFDESYQAVASAEANYHRNGFDASELAARFWCDDGLSRYDGEPFDLVLCNPPFHQSQVIGDQIAWQMFTQSKRHLRANGELWVVGNRHLNYHVKLKRIFGNAEVLASDPKFVVLVARK